MLDSQKIDLAPLKYFVVNMPSKAVRDYITNECTQLGIDIEKFYSAIEKVGYAGPPAAIISIDILLKNNSFKNGDMIFSFVMEVSKYMQAGFTIKYVE
jgi:3-oxoacyl-[acyl-carrier-protein] synthase III